ncbi:MAG: DUF5658 family protein [Methanoregula sp.]|nr:DUF5658 family protein [Methanoregula sp.]
MAEKQVVRAGGAYLPVNGISDGFSLWHIALFTSVIAMLFLLDILTTQEILNLGGVELNPAMVGIVGLPLMHVLIKFGFLLAVIPVTLVAESKVKGSGFYFYAALIALYTVVLINNALVLLPMLR